jgi:hypothetical protein
MVWWGAGRLRVERERACDERVLDAGTAPTSYARHLLGIARSARPLRLGSVTSLPLTRQSELESRLRLLFERPRARARGGRVVTGVVGFGGVAAALLLAAVRPIQGAPERAGGDAASSGEPARDERSAPARSAGRAPTSAGAEAAGTSGTGQPQDAAVARQAYEVRDSAGVRIVEHGLRPERAAPFRLSAEPVFRAESMPDGSAFEVPWAASLLRDGGAVIESGESRRLVFISPTGEVAMSGATPPDPDMGIFSITAVEGDTVLVQYTSMEQGTLAVLHGGGLVRQIPLDPEVANNKVMGVGSGGELLLGMPSMLVGGRPQWVPAALSRYDRRTERVDTVGVYDLGGPTFAFRFTQNGAAVVSGGRFVIGRSDLPELRWLDPDGALRQIVRWRRRPVTITDAMWSVYEAQIRAGAGSREGEDWIRRHMDGVKQSTEEAPLFRRLIPDDQGNVWVGSQGFPLEYWTPSGYDVISQQGVWLGSVAVPPTLRILAIGTDRVLGAEVDGREVRSIAVYRIES